MTTSSAVRSSRAVPSSVVGTRARSAAAVRGPFGRSWHLIPLIRRPDSRIDVVNAFIVAAHRTECTSMQTALAAMLNTGCISGRRPGGTARAGAG